MKAEGKATLSLFHELSEADRGVQDKAAKEMLSREGFEALNDIESSDFPIIPVREDFHFFPFRQLSATIVGGGGWKATDFSNEKVLKASAGLLEGKPAYLNHRIIVGEDVGHIGDVMFRKAYTNTNGDKIPSGIEAPFVIDKILQPKLVRKLSSPVSPIKSSSVTVFYDWEASHDFEDTNDFFWHLGEVIDGEMVRRIATDIIDYNESSMVWLGADPFAGMLDEKGQVINIDRAAQFSKHPNNPFKENRNYDSGKKYYVFDCFDQEHLLHLNKSFQSFTKENETHNTMNKQLLEFLAAQFNTTVEAIEKGTFTAEQAKKFKVTETEAFNLMKTNSEGFTGLQSEKTTLEAKVTELEAEKVTLSDENKTLTGEKTTLQDFKKENENFAKIGKTSLESAKEQAKKIYNSFANGKPDESILAELENETELGKLNTKIAMFGGKLAENFSAFCTKCESDENVQFRSSSPEGEEGGEKQSTSMAESTRN